MPVELILPSGPGEAETRRIIRDTVPRLVPYLESQWGLDTHLDELEFRFVRSHLAWRLKQLTLGGCLTSLVLWPALLLARSWKNRCIVKVWHTRDGACVWVRPVSVYAAEPPAPAPRWQSEAAAPSDAAAAWGEDLCAGLVSLFTAAGVPAWFCLGVASCFAEDKLGAARIDAAHADDVLRFAGWQARPAGASFAAAGQDAADLWHAVNAWPGLIVRYLHEARRADVADTLHQCRVDEALATLGIRRLPDDEPHETEANPADEVAPGQEEPALAKETSGTDRADSHASSAPHSEWHLVELQEFDELLAEALEIDHADYWPELARRAVAHFQKRDKKGVDLTAPPLDELIPSRSTGSAKLARQATRLWLGAMLLAVVVSCLLTWEAPFHWIWKAAIVLGSFLGAALVGFWIVQLAMFIARRSASFGRESAARPDA